MREDFDPELLLQRPLIAHLSTTERGEPRDSQLWFLWEEGALWIFGTHTDRFMQRLEKDSLYAAP